MTTGETRRQQDGRNSKASTTARTHGRPAQGHQRRAARRGRGRGAVAAAGEQPGGLHLVRAAGRADLWGIDPEVLAMQHDVGMLPHLVAAVILLFPCTEKIYAARTVDERALQAAAATRRTRGAVLNAPLLLFGGRNGRQGGKTIYICQTTTRPPATCAQNRSRPATPRSPGSRAPASATAPT